jgi:FKBP-type peptidyl-prolyl cis-trans isomerase FklB
MRISFLFLLCFFASVISVNAEESIDLNEKIIKESYSLGVSIGRTFKNQSMELDYEALFKGIKDARSGGDILLSDQEITDTLKNIQRELTEKREEEKREVAETNKRKGEEFLKQNAGKEGVVTLPSGLQYKVLVEGSGETPEISDTVTVHYRGTLIDGTEFDSSYTRGEPAVFNVNGVIPGFSEALQLMKTGSKWQIYIPSHLAYGERGAGRNIGPNEALIFDLELLSFTKGTKFHTDEMQP